MSDAATASPALPARLLPLRRWVLWRSEQRGGGQTKVPYRLDGRAASATNPGDWSTHSDAAAILAAKPGAYSGLGVVLGTLADGDVLAGLDLDTCLTDAGLAVWAEPFLNCLASYAEVSPSGTGIKVFFLVDAADVARFRTALGFKPAKHGTKRTFGTVDGGHPPAAELYLGARYFTVTGQRFRGATADLRHLDRSQLRALAALLNPSAGTTRPTAPAGAAVGAQAAPGAPVALQERLQAACARDRRMAARWQGDAQGLTDTSRSGIDMAIGVALRRAGFDYGEMRALLVQNSYGAGAERDAAGDERYFQRIWDRAGEDRPARPAAGTAADTARSGLPPLLARPARLPSPETIPPRAWLYGTHLVKGFVSVLVAPGGVGKTALATTIALAVATGRNLLGDRVWAPGPVWILNLEDPLEEVERRVAAAMRQHDLSKDDVVDQLFLHSGRDRPVVLAALDQVDGRTIAHPDKDDLILAMRDACICLLIVDPFVRSHGLEENSNPHMDAAAAVWADVAHQTNAAVLLVHHTRKGPAVDIEGSRGAKALTDAARIGLLLSPMTLEEANSLGVNPEQRGQFIRLDSGKANLTPRADKATWLRLESVALGNGNETYPSGDHVQAVISWQPSGPLAGLPVSIANEILDRIAEAFEAGEGLAPDKRGRGGGERWAGHLLVEHANLTEAQAKIIIKLWLETGLLIIDEVPTRDRHVARALRVIDSKRPQ